VAVEKLVGLWRCGVVAAAATEEELNDVKD
jgi:hypothetical protein